MYNEMEYVKVLEHGWLGCMFGICVAKKVLMGEQMLLCGRN